MIRSRFIEICHQALVADEATDHLDCRVMERFFADLIDLARRENHCNEIKNCFIDIIDGKIAAPTETLGYCMRALRYDEVIVASARRLGDPPDPRWMNAHAGIVAAVADESWSDCDLWEQDPRVRVPESHNEPNKSE